MYLLGPGEKRRPPAEVDVLVHLGDSGGPGSALHHNFQHFWPLAAGLQEPVLTFLQFALGVWAADKLIPRPPQPDAWTREINLEIPAAAPLGELVPAWAPLAHFLTGDAWTIRARPARVALPRAGPWPHAWQPTAVCLFSGGLDSLAGTLDLLAEGHRLVLVSHADYGQLAAGQQALAAALMRHYGPERVHHLALRVQCEGPELTLRSRSLLYIALGLTAAAAFPGPPPLIMPENGWISLNPPLTLNRLGTYSTRTTHPFFLGELTARWRLAGLSSKLFNPYRELTKGEVLARCRQPSLLASLAPLTISCARPVVGRWQRQPAGSCGYCYPCLVRRAALHRLGWDRGTDYRVDVLSSADILRHRDRGRDLRAVLIALRTWEDNPHETLARLWLSGPPARLASFTAAARRLLRAGFLELSQWLQDQASPAIRAFLL